MNKLAPALLTLVLIIGTGSIRVAAVGRHHHEELPGTSTIEAGTDHTGYLYKWSEDGNLYRRHWSYTRGIWLSDWSAADSLI